MNASILAIATLLTLAHDNGDQDAIGFFESYEETCLGWDGEPAMRNAESLGICEYFAREVSK